MRYLDPLDETNAARWIFAWQAGCLLMDGGLDHTIEYTALQDLNSAPLAAELFGKVTSAKFSGRWLWEAEVRSCDAYRIGLGMRR